MIFTFMVGYKFANWIGLVLNYKLIKEYSKNKKLKYKNNIFSKCENENEINLNKIINELIFNNYFIKRQ